MSTVAGEQILVIKREKLNDLIPPFQGFRRADEAVIKSLFLQGGLFFTERKPAEENSQLKQLIPYVLFFNAAKPGQVYAYRRTPKGGESRLHGKRSIGVGGHIEPADGLTWTGYLRAMQREIHEEVEIASLPHMPAVYGLINDDSNPVGQVHLGIVHTVAVPQVPARRCADLADDGFLDLFLGKQHRGEFEPWSQLCIDHLIKDATDTAKELAL